MPLHAAAEDTMKHPYTPAAFVAQHAPCCGGHVTPAQVEPTPWNVPPALVHAAALSTM